MSIQVKNIPEQKPVLEQCLSLCRVIVATLTEAKTRRELTGNESVFLESAEYILKQSETNS